MRAVVVLQLLFAGKDRLFVNELDDGLFAANTDRIGGRAGATGGERVEGVFCGASSSEWKVMTAILPPGFK